MDSHILLLFWPILGETNQRLDGDDFGLGTKFWANYAKYVLFGT